jgi:hypothetical protein
MKKVMLLIGYEDKSQVTHRDVEIGKVLYGSDLFTIDEDPQNSGPTSREFLILRSAITKFGTLTVPVALSVLIALDSLDRDDLLEAYNNFVAESLDGRTSEFLPDNKVRLARGYESEGIVFDVVEFGTRLTGHHYIEADALELSETKRAFYLVGQQVVRLSQSEGKATLSGPMSVEECGTLVVPDLFTLRGGAELFRQSFRQKRAAVQGASGEDSVSSDEPHGANRGANTGMAG